MAYSRKNIRQLLTDRTRSTFKRTKLHACWIIKGYKEGDFRGTWINKALAKVCKACKPSSNLEPYSKGKPLMGFTQRSVIFAYF